MTADYTLTPNAILMFAQDCFARMMTLCNVAAFDVVKDNRMWVITEYTADVGPLLAFWSEEVDVELWVSELTSLRIYIDFRIVRAGSELLVAKGSFQMNILNMLTHKLEATVFLQGRFAVLPEMMTHSHKKQRFPKEGVLLAQTEHKVTRLDVDFNGHMGNRGYVDLALLTLPDDLLRSRRLTQMTVHWLHESHMDDVLHCSTFGIVDSNDTYLHTIAGPEGTSVCELLTRWTPDCVTPNIAETLVRK